MPPNPLTQLRLLAQRLARDTKRFPCPHCATVLLSKEFEKHCTKHHKINAKQRCVWCLGKESWLWGQKTEHVDHLLECWRKFMALRTYQTPTNTTEFDSSLLCEPRQFFNHARDLPPQAYEPVCPMPLDPIQFFQDPNLNLAATCIRKYFELPNAEWFHIMVRAVAYPSFVDAVKADKGLTLILPFFCWCDGGRYPEAKHRQHLHAIVICLRKGHFKPEVWDKVKTTDRPGRNFLCKRSKPITSPMHLVNTLGYLSKRESKCIFSFTEEDVKENLNHFYINTPLPVDYRFALVTQWDGGILELVHQDFKHADPKKLVEVPMTFFNSRWQIQVKHLPGIRMNVALPLSSQFYLSTDPTPFYIHLAQGKKVYFERSQQQEASEEVRFYAVVGDEWWTPCQHQQNCLNTLKPVSDRNAELEAENVSLKRKHEDLKKEITSLKRKYADEDRSWKRAKLELETENQSLKRKREVAEEEAKSLLREFKDVNETENERLKTENVKWKNYAISLEKKLKKATYIGPDA